jgi:hypothetical protein
VRVASTSEFVAALDASSVGSVVEVAAGSVIDLSDFCWMPIRARVTVRGAPDGSGKRPTLPVARLVYHTSPTDPRDLCCRQGARNDPNAPIAPCSNDVTPPDREEMAVFAMWGEGARFTSLAFEGPSTSTAPKFSVIGVQTQNHQDLYLPELRQGVDHSDLYGFPLAAVDVWGARPEDVSIEQCQTPPPNDPRVLVQRNYIHANRRDGAGYGVVVAGDGRAAIFGNTFMGNRHAISGTGDSGQSYYAFGNRRLFSAPQQDGFPNQDFDMHGTGGGSDCIGSNSGRGGTAGDVQEIRHNTFFGHQRNNFLLRGSPCRYALFSENVTRQSEDPWFDYQAAAVDDCDDDADPNFIEQDNRYDIDDPTSNISAHDFDGDGRDDLFLSTGAAWYVSFGGRTNWKFRAIPTDEIDDLRFGDFDGDGRVDVIRSTSSLDLDVPAAIQVRWGGEGDWMQLLKLDADVDDLLVGDFDADGVDDIIHPTAQTWTIFTQTSALSWPQSVWPDPVFASSVRVADFDNDGRDDVILERFGDWVFASGGVPTSLVLLGDSRGSFGNLRFIDVNGNGRADAVRTRYQRIQVQIGLVRYRTTTDVSYDCATAFTDARTYERLASGMEDDVMRVAPLGRFDGQLGADILHWREDRRLDIQTSTLGNPTLHSFQDGLTKNEMY